MRYTGAAVTLAFRLGLHQSQKRFSLGALTRETRKKVFWSLYTLDWYVLLTRTTGCYDLYSIAFPPLFSGYRSS